MELSLFAAVFHPRGSCIAATLRMSQCVGVVKALWDPRGWKAQYCFGLSRELLLGALPHLMKLDTQLIPSWRDADPAEEEEEEGASDDSDSEEDDDVPELTGPFCADKGDQAAAVSHDWILLLVHMGKSR